MKDQGELMTLRLKRFGSRRLPPTLSMMCLSAIALTAGCSRSFWISERGEKKASREFALDLYDEGVRFSEAKNYEIAQDRLNKSVALDPRPAAFFQLAQAQMQTGDVDSAIISYTSSLERAPDFQEARLALIEQGFTPPTEAEMKSDPAAFGRFKSSVETTVETRRADLMGKGLTEEQREKIRLKTAGQQTDAAASRIPTASEVHAALFPATLAEGEIMPSATDPTFADDRSIILNTYPYHFGNGQRFQKNQEYEKAASEYQLALQISPDAIDARLNLGDCMLRLERFPQARFHFLTAIEQFPDSPRPLFKMGNLYDSSERPDMARQYYRQAIAKDPQYIEAYNNLGAIEIREKNYKDAIQILRTATDIRPEYPLAYLNLGVAQENGGDPAAALVSYKKYVELGGEQAAEVSKWIEEMQ